LFIIFFILFKLTWTLNTKLEIKNPILEKLDSKTIIVNKAKFKNNNNLYNFMLGVSYYKESEFKKAFDTLKKVTKLENLEFYIMFYKASSSCRAFENINLLENSLKDFYSILSTAKGAIINKANIELRECEFKLAKLYLNNKDFKKSYALLLNAKSRAYLNLEEEFNLYNAYLQYNKDIALSLLLDLHKNNSSNFKIFIKNIDKKYLSYFDIKENISQSRKAIINNKEEENLILNLRTNISKKNYNKFLNISLEYIDKFIQGRELNNFYDLANNFILSSIKENKKNINFYKKLLEKYMVNQQTSILISLWQDFNFKNAEALINIMLASNLKNDRAIYLIGSYYEDKGDLKKAKEFYKILKDGYSTSIHYHRSLFKFAWIKFLEKDYSLSLNLFTRYLEEAGSDEKWDISSAYYYIALSYKNLSDIDNYTATLAILIKEYPYSFYSILARENLGISLVEELKNLKNSATDSIEAVSILDLYYLNLANSLVYVLLYDEAVEELKNININNLSPKYLEYISNIYKYTNNPELGISIAYNLMFSHKAYLSKKHIEIHYPKLYFDLISYYSGVLEVDPYLVLSIIKRESAFNKNAVSRAGARGLMQIMPALARQMIKNINIESLNKPDININLGVDHLKSQLNKYNNNLIYVLASYNAGDRPLARWIKWYGERLNQLEFIESISFAETRNYVKAVISFYYIYNALYNNKDLKFEYIINNKEEE